MNDAVAPSWCTRYIGLPYVDRGRDRDGVDCYGLVALVNVEQFGRAVPDYAYASSLDHDAVAATIHAHLPHDWAQVARPACGDLVMMTIAGRPWHCGIWVAEGLMLHAIDGARSGIDRLDSVRWRRRVTGFYRPAVRA